MMIHHEIKEDILTVRPEGRLDTLNAPELERFLQEWYEQFRQIVFDLEKVSYISSAGLRVLVQAYKFMKEKDGILLRNVVSAQVRELLQLTGYAHVLPIIS